MTLLARIGVALVVADVVFLAGRGAFALAQTDEWSANVTTPLTLVALIGSLVIAVEVIDRLRQ